MNRPRIVLVLVLAGILVAAALIWLNLPGAADLAGYAPADSIVYVEINSLAAVAHAIQQTDVWQATAPITRSEFGLDKPWLLSAARAGIGPVESVLFARTQMALVVVALNTAEQNDTLKVRPELALIAETHTSRWRTRPVMVAGIRQLATYAWGASSCVGPDDDSDHFECSIPGGDRKIVGAIAGTTVILANSDNALKSCLEVRNGSRPSLATEGEFIRLRSSVATGRSLGFGYISSANSAKIFSWAAPLLMGIAPGDQQLQQLLATSAGKILRGIAWTAVTANGGIEDRFLFPLEQEVVERLKPAFQTSQRDDGFWNLVPGGFQSLTIYRSREPAAAWTSLDSAVAFKLDALPAVLFGSLLKSSLLVYGIANPKEALVALSPPLLTMKPASGAEGSILVARVNDEAVLKRSLQQKVDDSEPPQILEGLQADPDSGREFAAIFVGGYVLLGKTENMRRLLLELRNGQAGTTDEKKKVQVSAQESTAPIVTYANDEERLMNFLSTLTSIRGRRLSGEELAKLQDTVRKATFAETETRLSAAGIERKTQSAFGQFSTFVSLLQPDQNNSLANRR